MPISSVLQHNSPRAKVHDDGTVPQAIINERGRDSHEASAGSSSSEHLRAKLCVVCSFNLLLCRCGLHP